MMSQHPEVEAKILAELDGTELTITPQRPPPSKMAYADMNPLTYLQAAIKVPGILSSHPQAAALLAVREACCAVSAFCTA